MSVSLNPLVEMSRLFLFIQKHIYYLNVRLETSVTSGNEKAQVSVECAIFIRCARLFFMYYVICVSINVGWYNIHIWIW